MERAIPLLRRLLLRRRTRYSLLIALSIIVALAIAALLRKAAPPEVARLLPESDAIFYIDLKPIRAATHFDRSWDKDPVEHAPDYQHFLDATGILPERDLDRAAFAIHRMDDPNGPNGPVAYSEVFEGRFDSRRLAQYLDSIAVTRESYAGHKIYTIVMEPATKTTPARNLRVVQLGYDTLAASNMPTTEQIHSILDRYSASASPFSGSSLLNARYREVPLLSSAWAIGRIGLPFSQGGKVQVFGVGLPLPADTTFVASLRFVGALHLRIEEIAPSEADAAQSASSLNAILSLLKSFAATQLAPTAVSGPGYADLRKFLDSLAIQQDRDRVLLTGSISLDLLRETASSQAK
jgi:hypothetical protein